MRIYFKFQTKADFPLPFKHWIFNPVFQTSWEYNQFFSLERFKKKKVISMLSTWGLSDVMLILVLSPRWAFSFLKASLFLDYRTLLISYSVSNTWHFLKALFSNKLWGCIVTETIKTFFPVYFYPGMYMMVYYAGAPNNCFICSETQILPRIFYYLRTAETF